MKKEIKLTADLKEALLNGATIIACFNGEFRNTIIVKNTLEYINKNGWKWSIYQNLHENDDMVLSEENSMTKKDVIERAKEDHYQDEIFMKNKK